MHKTKSLHERHVGMCLFGHSCPHPLPGAGARGSHFVLQRLRACVLSCVICSAFSWRVNRQVDLASCSILLSCIAVSPRSPPPRSVAVPASRSLSLFHILRTWFDAASMVCYSCAMHCSISSYLLDEPNFDLSNCSDALPGCEIVAAVLSLISAMSHVHSCTYHDQFIEA